MPDALDQHRAARATPVVGRALSFIAKVGWRHHWSKVYDLLLQVWIYPDQLTRAAHAARPVAGPPHGIFRPVSAKSPQFNATGD
jgi:hypothetical protein